MLEVDLVRKLGTTRPKGHIVAGIADYEGKCGPPGAGPHDSDPCRDLQGFGSAHRGSPLVRSLCGSSRYAGGVSSRSSATRTVMASMILVVASSSVAAVTGCARR